MARLRYLTRDQVEFVAHRLAARLFTDYGDPLPAFELFGGIREGGSLLDSALGLPRQPYYRTLFDKAGALLRSMIKNHPLVDGNKRVGMTSALVFLMLNRHFLVASNEEMVAFALEVATKEPDMSWQEVAVWLRERSVHFATPKDAIDVMMGRFPAEWNEPRASAIQARLLDYGVAVLQLRPD